MGGFCGTKLLSITVGFLPKSVVLPKLPPAQCFLDSCEFLGVFNGEKRWRIGKKLLTWDSLHGEIEVLISRVSIWVS